MPSALESKPTDIENCFNVSQSQTYFYNGNIGSFVTDYYYNSATTSNFLTFNQNSGNIEFESTNPSINPDTNTKYGALVNASENLVTLNITAPTSLVAVPSAIHFRKSSVNNGADNNYFTSMSSSDPNTNENAGFRVESKFSLVNITSTHFGTNNNSQLITYDLSSNINATNYFNDDNTYAKIEKSI